MAETKNSKNIKTTNGARKPATDALARPGKLDFAKADKLAKKLIRDNEEWLKEMAER